MTATTSPLTLTSRPETAVRAGRRTWSRRTSFWLAVATPVLVLAASNFPTPLFPIYAQRYHFGAATVTLFFSVYVAALIPAMLTLGRITDRVGRRPALVAGMAITAVSSVAFAAARNVGWLFAGEIIELIRPVVLFGQSPADRARQTGTSRRSLYRKAAAFAHLGMAGLTAEQPAGAGQRLPPDVRAAILDLKAEYAGFGLREIAAICGVPSGPRFGRRPDHHTAQRILADAPLPEKTTRRYPPLPPD